jgi:tRNA 2-thiouridine synthesizing protein A
MPNTAAQQVLDTIGLRCPLPVLKARKALSGLAAGDVLEILADDPAAAQDFVVLCQVTGHRLLGQTRDGNVLRFLVESAGPPAEAAG